MPVQYPPIKAPLAVCDVCEASKPFVETDEDDAEEVTGYLLVDGHAEGRARFRLPDGYVAVVGSRLEPNPEWHDLYREFKAMLTEQAQNVIQAGVTDDQRRQIEADLEEQIGDYEPEVPRTTVVRVESCLCPEHAEMLQTRLGAPEWGEYEAG